mmetsp:Transcript_10828/g.25237  ORF Transcript_10828/g.25237 Transcript_10828/m.25237 type:complete len:85 (-) Transcript_10828:898-1152(-)
MAGRSIEGRTGGWFRFGRNLERCFYKSIFNPQKQNHALNKETVAMANLRPQLGKLIDSFQAFRNERLFFEIIDYNFSDNSLTTV